MLHEVAGEVVYGGGQSDKDEPVGGEELGSVFGRNPYAESSGCGEEGGEY